MTMRALAARAPFGWPAALALTFLTALSAACAAHKVDRLMQGWHGRQMRELFTTWGPPRYAYADGGGGYVLLYVPDAALPTSGNQRLLASGTRTADQLVRGAEPESEPVYTPDLVASWRVFRAFFVDAHQKVYRSQWKGKWDCCGT
jgi:hypothetical protein